MLILSNNAKEQKVKVGYMSGNTEMYITKIKPDGTIYSTTDIRKGKKMEWNKALSIQMELESEGTKARKIYN